MAVLDFTGALARLLRDGRLRDGFGVDPGMVVAQFGLKEGDRAALLGLRAEDLEYQAVILLRKRFDAMRRVIPRTCAELGDASWPAFLRYARGYLPEGQPVATADAQAFCEHLQSVRPGAVDAREWNQVCFALSRARWTVRWLHRAGERKRGCLQILFRLGAGGPQEILLYAGL